ncbi:MAG: hypothetical protein K0R54_750 [Clostridiaceae bacterium]|jgi:hypothetical protein|nr:hypothetical protein [Clostridiaceae bacterium]
MKILKTIEDIKQIKYGDYLEGKEHYGHTIRTAKGLFHKKNINGIAETVDIQMNDEFGGARENYISLKLGEIKILEPGDKEYDKAFIEKNLKK